MFTIIFRKYNVESFGLLSQGGLVFLSDKKCPWKIRLKETEIYYYDKKVKNIWNPRGNGWKLEPSDKITLVR